MRSLITLLALFLAMAPVLRAGESQFVFRADSKSVSYDAEDPSLEVPVDLHISQDPSDSDFPADTEGFSFAVSHDPEVLSVLSAEAAGILADLNSGAGPEFLSINTDLDGVDGVVIAVVYNILPPGDSTIAFTAPSPVVTLTYDVVPEAIDGNSEGLTTDITWADSLGSNPSVSNVVTVDGTSQTPLLVDGELRLRAGLVLFVRGDVNGDGAVIALLDALVLLAWQFLEGPEPPCLSAADVDDNGSVSPLIDALAILSWQFQLGAEPPDPGPLQCGADPTEDSLGCLIEPECP